MKKIAASLIMTLVTSQSFAYVAAVQVFAPAGTRVVPSGDYTSTSDSFLCTSYSLEDNFRKPKTYAGVEIKVQQRADSTVVAIPDSIEKCNSINTGFTVEIAFPGSLTGAESNTINTGIRFEETDTDISEIQVIPCRKIDLFAVGDGKATVCDQKSVLLGPKRAARIQIVEQE